jgi:hypothetical protein
MSAIRSRLRLAVTALLLAITGLLLGTGVAAAADYVPTPVTTPELLPTQLTIAPTDPAQLPPVQALEVPTTTTPSTGGLAYTGAGINIGMTIGIAVAVLVVGAALILVGTRMSRRRG